MRAVRYQEIEIKLAVRDPPALKRRLAQLGFHPVRARHFERNIVFDFSDHRLRGLGYLLRLRLVDHQGLLTFKGPAQPDRRYKVRREIETPIPDPVAVKDILRRLGLKEVFRYEKYRSVFAVRGRSKERVSGCLLAYDETPIGDYVELEGPKRWIDRMAGQLGYRPQDYIPATYAVLYLQSCLQRGERPGHMVFANRRLRLGAGRSLAV